MKKCLYCGEEIIKSSPWANNVKYCSKLHRERHYAAQGLLADRQRRFMAKKHVKPFPGARQCIVCGLWYRAVCHHAWQAHELSEREYKEMAGLDHKKGLIPGELKELKAEYVFENGTVQNLKKGTPKRFVQGDKRAGDYKRSPQTVERLKRQSWRMHT